MELYYFFEYCFISCSCRWRVYIGSNDGNVYCFGSEDGLASGGGSFYPDSESTLPGGKANFGFSKSLTASVSDGKLQFNYKDADIDLQSEGIDWVVISANEVTFQGTATINNQGEYTFRVSATDNSKLGKNQDTFSIIIWQGRP
jgi:hypothetical protein